MWLSWVLLAQDSLHWAPDEETEVQRLSNFPQHIASKWLLPCHRWVSGNRSQPGREGVPVSPFLFKQR